MLETIQTKNRPNCCGQAWFQNLHPWVFFGHVSVRRHHQTGDQTTFTKPVGGLCYFPVLSLPCACWRHITTLCRWPEPKTFVWAALHSFHPPSLAPGAWELFAKVLWWSQPEIPLVTVQDEVPFVSQMHLVLALAHKWLLSQNNKSCRSVSICLLKSLIGNISLARGQVVGEREKPLNAFAATMKIPLLVIQLLAI